MTDITTDTPSPEIANPPETPSGDCGAMPCSSSEFAVQYWRAEKFCWWESSIYDSEDAAYHAYIQINAVFPDSSHRVVKRVATESVIFGTNAKSDGTDASEKTL